jgi:hypothetical protein
MASLIRCPGQHPQAAARHSRTSLGRTNRSRGHREDAQSCARHRTGPRRSKASCSCDRRRRTRLPAAPAARSRAAATAARSRAANLKPCITPFGRRAIFVQLPGPDRNSARALARRNFAGNRSRCRVYLFSFSHQRLRFRSRAPGIPTVSTVHGGHAWEADRSAGRASNAGHRSAEKIRRLAEATRLLKADHSRSESVMPGRFERGLPRHNMLQKWRAVECPA